MTSRVALVAAWIFLVSGLMVAAVLLVGAQRRPGAQIDAFARAGVGCTTTVRVERAGEYFVFAELGAEPVERAGCVPVADPQARFSVAIAPVDGVVVADDDRSVVYTRGAVSAGSVLRLVAEGPADLQVAVAGSDPGVVAAIGPDPDSGVDERRAVALIVGALTLLVGGTLLVVASRAGTSRAEAPAPPRSPWGPPNPEEWRG